MDMRLGKCMVVIRRCKMYKPIHKVNGLRVLVVAPSSALEGWKTELQREHEPTALIITGTRKQRLIAIHEVRKWTLINKEAFLSIPEIANIPWDVVVCDESTFLKNARAKVTKFFLRNFRNVPHKWMLTGTPAVTDCLDWVCQFLWVDGTFQGYKNFWDYRAEQCRMFGYEYVPKDKKTIINHVSRRCFIKTRAQAGVYDKREHIQRNVTMPEHIMKMYKKAETEYDLDGKWIMYSIQRYTYLRQLASGFSEGKLVWDGKFQELQYLLDDQVDGQCMIWFAYNQELKAAAALLKAPYLSGEHDLAQRNLIIDLFRAGAYKILCMQVAIGKMGLDLSCADTCIYFSKPTSPEAYIQSKERIYNINKPRILLQMDISTKDTVDEDVAVTMDDRIFSSNADLELALIERMRQRHE